MNKIFIIFTILTYTLLAETIPLYKLPKKSLDFVNENFKDSTLYRAIEDFGNYTLIFKGGLKVFVDNNGDWYRVINPNGIKITFLEKEVQRTIRKQYKDDVIIHLHNHKEYYSIKLKNGTYIKIKADGNIIE